MLGRLAGILFILIFQVAAVNAVAEPYRRHVETEWEPIEGAKSYEIELTLGQKTLKFKTTDPVWSGRLVPGVYGMRLRAKDARGVPGDWSPSEPFKVGLETPAPQSPKADEKIMSDQEEKTPVAFHWGTIGGAHDYVLSVKSDDGSFTKEEKLAATNLTLTLPVGHAYRWEVKGIGPDGESDEPAKASFNLYGKRLEPVKFDKPENDFVREIKWERPDHTKDYRYSLQRYDGKEKKWEKVAGDQHFEANQLNFDPQWPGGTYRITAVAQGELRPDSERSRIQFKVRSGDRSPAAEESATIRQSIDRLTGWYAIASYLVTVMDYQGVNYDRANSRLHYSAIGGTGRVGAGFFPTSGGPFGFLGIVDYSGLTIDGGGTYTYASAEGNLIYRTDVGARGELRQQAGIFYKELPETAGPSATQITETNNLKTIGPHYGVEYWYAMTPKLGFQLNLHLYPALMAMKTTNGEKIDPTISTQLGLLGSYRLQKNLTGLLGYAYRRDRTDYMAVPGQGSAKSGDVNSVQITGHYLNLFLEWAL